MLLKPVFNGEKMREERTKYFSVALCPNDPPDAMPSLEICQLPHETLEKARACWYARTDEFRQQILEECRSHNYRVVIWENEVIDRLHSLGDA